MSFKEIENTVSEFRMIVTRMEEIITYFRLNGCLVYQTGNTPEGAPIYDIQSNVHSYNVSLDHLAPGQRDRTINQWMFNSALISYNLSSQAEPSSMQQPGASNMQQPGASNMQQQQPGPSSLQQPGPSNMQQQQAGPSTMQQQPGPSRANQGQAVLKSPGEVIVVSDSDDDDDDEFSEEFIDISEVFQIRRPPSELARRYIPSRLSQFRRRQNLNNDPYRYGSVSSRSSWSSESLNLKTITPSSSSSLSAFYSPTSGEHSTPTFSVEYSPVSASDF